MCTLSICPFYALLCCCVIISEVVLLSNGIHISITVHLVQWDFPKWHGPWWPAATTTAAAAAWMHLQRWRSPCWYRMMAAIHGRSLEIRATKPLITLWAFNPPAAPSEWNAISLLQLKRSGERTEQATRDIGGQTGSGHVPGYHAVTVISAAVETRAVESRVARWTWIFN